MDLEESLRMLVNLQETSEYIVDSQRKNWITLLDEDEDEEDNVVKMAKEKQIDLPSFSLVRDTSLKIEKLGGRGVKNPSTEQKESKPEKEKIPKVIAKLMGLNELPKHENLMHTSEEDLSSKSKRERHVIEQTTNERNTTFVSQAEKNMLANNISLRGVVHDPKEFKPMDKPVMQAKPGFKEIWIPVEKQNGNNILPRNQQHKSPYNVELQQQSMALKSESPKEKRRWETKEQQI
ncbi:hypothetical protein FF1_016345 [Malus domestica]